MTLNNFSNYLNTATTQKTGVEFFDDEISNQIDWTKNRTINILEKKESVLVLDQSEIINLNEEELLEIILQKLKQAENEGIFYDKIDFSQEYSSITKQKLNNIIGENFPLLNIHRLVPSHDVLNINFGGIKNLNDQISKEFVDLFINNFKNFIITNYKNNFGENQNTRLVRNNYKNITFSLPKNNDINQILFDNQNNKSEVIKQIFDGIKKGELQNILNNSGNNINVEQAKKILLQYFDFNIGKTNLGEQKNTTKEKLEEFYKSEIASRLIPKSEEIEVFNYDYSKIKSLTKEAFELEQKIITDYEGQKIELDGTSYPIIKILPNGEKIISDELLRITRKQKNFGDKKLQELVKKYIENLNNGYDFIAPVLHTSQFEQIKKIDQEISKGKISTKYLQKNYKGTYSKNALENNIKGKNGTRFFIDIVDMGLMNLDDFRTRAKKVQSGEIDEQNLDLLLESGFSVTEKFQEFIRQISQIEGLQTSVGGDEVFLFFEGNSNSQIKEIIEKINNNLKNYQLRGRISYEEKDTDKNIFDKLDNFSSINKALENIVEKTIINNNLIISRTNNICMKIDNEVKKNILKDINGFIKNLEYFADIEKIKNILSKISDDNQQIAFFEGYQVFLQKDKNNNLMLEIKNK